MRFKQPSRWSKGPPETRDAHRKHFSWPNQFKFKCKKLENIDLQNLNLIIDFLRIYALFKNFHQ